MSATAYVAIENFFQQFIWLALFFIVAPVLGPKPFGEFAIAMVFIGFCEIIMVDALVEALLGMENLDRRHLNTLNFIALSLAAVVGVCMFLASPLIGRVFGDEQLESIFKALSILPALSALTAAPVAVLKHQVRFGPITLRSTLGLAIGGICGAILAFRGAGVWALVVQVLAQRASEAVILWATAHTRFGMSWSKAHFVELRRFAMHVAVSKGAAFAAAQIPRLILGFFLGPYDLGLFVFASRMPTLLNVITVIPFTTVARVTLRQHRSGDVALFQEFSRLVQNAAIIALPIYLGAVVTMPLMFSLALDARWQPAALLSQIMVLTTIPMFVCNCATAVLWALKHPQDEARISLGQISLNTLIVLLAAPFGITVVCYAILLRHLTLLPYVTNILSKRSGITSRLIGASMGPALGASITMGIVVAAISFLLQNRLGPAAMLLVLVAVGILVYVIAIAIVAREPAIKMLRDFLKRRKLTASSSQPNGNLAIPNEQETV